MIMAEPAAGVTRQPIPPGSYVAAAAAAAAAVTALLVYLSIWGRRYGLDLNVYRDAVSYWRSGRDPYLTVFTGRRLAFTYPPFAFLVLSPLSWFSFTAAQWLLWTVSIAAATGSVALILRERGLRLTPGTWCKAFAWSCAAGVVLEPVRSALDYGQIEFILMFAIIADLLIMPSRYRGILIGIAAAVKLTPLIFIAVLIVNKDLKSAIRAAASFLACTAISWLFWPVSSRVYWFHELSNPGRVGTISYSGNQSWYAIFHRPPFHGGGSTFGWLLLSLITLAAAIFIAWRCMHNDQKPLAVITVALAGLLVSPISWTHHWIWVILIPPMIAVRRNPGEPRHVRPLLWGLIALAAAAPYWWFSHGILADAAAAILPLWAAAVLAALATVEFLAWRGNDSNPSIPKVTVNHRHADPLLRPEPGPRQGRL